MAKIELSNLSKFIKSKVDETYNGDLKAAIKQWSSEASEPIKSLIIGEISKGISPVKEGGGQTGGGQRFVEYSRSYKEQINHQAKTKRGVLGQNGKRERPVNLKVTGGLHNSIKVRPINKGISVYYTSPLAKYHNDLGAGKSRTIRKILPTEAGQTFSRLIMSRIVDIFEEILRQKNG